MKKVGLALSGGGARGLAHIGVLKVLDKLKVRPTCVSGCSMGSVVAAFYCLGYSGKQIEKKVDEITTKQLLRFIFSRKSNGDKIENFLNKLLQDKNFEDLIIPLYINAVDVNTGEEIVFNKGNLAKAIRASISIPMIFKPEIINDRILVDGGVREDLPIQILIDKKMDKIIGVNAHSVQKSNVKLEGVGNNKKHNQRLPTSRKILAKAIAIIQSNKHIIDFYKENCDLLIIPNLTNYDSLGFSDKKKIIRLGEQAANKSEQKIRLIFRSQISKNNFKDFFTGGFNYKTLKSISSS